MVPVVVAWRLHESVIRGEIDNRQRGVVVGRVWLHGLSDSVVLELRGNAAADLAGCMLTFENPAPVICVPPEGRFCLRQRGTIGDLTASRKVRVLDVPLLEAYELKSRGLPVPEHLANCLYLEWFSESNGRVVIESADYTLTISEPLWRLSAAEEQSRRHQVAEGLTGFMQRLGETLADEEEPDEDEGEGSP